MKSKRRHQCIALIIVCAITLSAAGCGAKPTAQSASAPVATSSSAPEPETAALGLFSEAGTYMDDVDGDATVDADGVILSGMSVTGDLIISEQVAEGDVTLNDVTVKGRTIIRGGGVNSVEANGSTLNELVLEKENSPVRFRSNQSTIGNVTVATSAVLDGSFPSVSCQAGSSLTSNADIQSLTLSGDASVTVESGKITSATLEQDAAKAALTVGKQASISDVTLLSPAQLVVNGSVEKATIAASAAGAKLTGTGTLAAANVAGNNVSIDIAGTKISTEAGVTGLVAKGADKPATTPSTTPRATAPSGSPAAGPPSVDIPSYDDSDSGSSDSSDSSGSSESSSISISKVESVRNGLVRVTLSTATPYALPLSSFSILCTGGGKDMTIQRVHTTNNRVYDLTTAYYNDNTYSLEVLLSNGRRIYRDFVSKYDCPEISSTLVRRTSTAQAEFRFSSDTAGTFYYLAQPVQSKARAAVSGEPTAEQMMQSGVSVPMALQSNTVTVSDLIADTAYVLYYVAKGADGKVTSVKSIDISATVDKLQQGSITVTAASGFDIPGADATEELCGFTITLSEPTGQPLKLGAFQISCPASGTMSIGRVETTDRQTYTIYMKPGYLYQSNNTMTANITFPNGDFTTYDFYVDISAPTTGIVTITRPSDTTAEASFSASETGWIYYAILDNVENTTAAKDPAFLFEEGAGVTKAALSTTNKILLDNVAAGQYFCYATEDSLGNRATYMGYEEIPVYTPSTNPPSSAPQITGVAYSLDGGKPTFVITFDKAYNLTKFDHNQTSITGAQGKPLFGRDAISGTDSQTMTLRITNGATVASGNQTLTLVYSGETITVEVTIP